MHHTVNPLLAKSYEEPAFDIESCPSFSVEEHEDTQAVECLAYPNGDKTYSSEASLGEIAVAQDCANCPYNKQPVNLQRIGSLTVWQLVK